MALGGSVFNVGCGKTFSLNFLVAEIRKLFGRDIRVENAPPRTGDVSFSCASIERAQAALGYAPLVEFEQGLRLTWEWVQNERR